MGLLATIRVAALGCGLVPVLAAAVLAQNVDAPRNVLVFRDSITWGWLPKNPIVPTVRHAEEDRWPVILGAAA